MTFLFRPSYPFNNFYNSAYCPISFCRIIGFFSLICGFIITLCVDAQAQQVIGLSTQYDDRYDKWIIVTDTEGLEGTIEATWAMLGDFTEWQYNLGDQSGIIRMRQKNDPNVWEVLGGGEIIEARTVFPGERNHWQINNGRIRVDVKTYRPQPEQWLVEYKQEEIYFYTYQEYDLRDWVVENKATFNLPMQLALIFIPILQVIGP